jgi:hypothetical protein
VSKGIVPGAAGVCAKELSTKFPIPKVAAAESAAAMTATEPYETRDPFPMIV